MDDFEILEGDLHGLADTASFLRVLARLDEEGDVQASDRAEKPQERERLAAAGLFRWEVWHRLASSCDTNWTSPQLDTVIAG